MARRRQRALSSCKYGAECGLVIGCPDGCDCCLDVHACECEPDISEWDDDPEAMDDDGGTDGLH